jgi:glutamate/tyrosine decarboxylase-like PLP-dependent enzyme
MAPAIPANAHVSLDPDDWSAFRALAHQVVDDTVDQLRTLGERPAWSPLPEAVRALLSIDLGADGVGEVAAYKEYLALIEPYTNGNRHPRFFGWVQGQGIPLASLAEFLASSMNPHMAGFNQSGPVVEEQVLNCMKQPIGYPRDASGILLSGGTMANVTGLAVARAAKYPGNYVIDGLQSRQFGPLVFYGSHATHGWAAKAADLLGFGRDAYVSIATDANQRILLDALQTAVHRDRDRGRFPFCVIGNAGTINTGAIDPLVDLAEFCRAQDLWFHIDGAFGALAALSPRHRDLVTGLESADSVAFDLHKWMYLPFEIGCILIRDAQVHQSAFDASGDYIRTLERGVIQGGLPFAQRGIELTRGFKALKAWMCLRAYGTRRFADAIERNIDDIQALAEQIRTSKDLELLAPVPLNVVCFRYRVAELSDTTLNELNEEILYRIQESGFGVLSSTMLDGRFALRMANVNHRATFGDLTRMTDAVVRIGRTLNANRSADVKCRGAPRGFPPTRSF